MQKLTNSHLRYFFFQFRRDKQLRFSDAVIKLLSGLRVETQINRENQHVRSVLKPPHTKSLLPREKQAQIQKCSMDSIYIHGGGGGAAQLLEVQDLQYTAPSQSHENLSESAQKALLVGTKHLFFDLKILTFTAFRFSFVLDNVAVSSIEFENNQMQPKVGTVIPPYNAHYDKHPRAYFNFAQIDKVRVAQLDKVCFTFVFIYGATKLLQCSKSSSSSSDLWMWSLQNIL